VALEQILAEVAACVARYQSKTAQAVELLILPRSLWLERGEAACACGLGHALMHLENLSMLLAKPPRPAS